MILETKRLILRPWEESDAENLFKKVLMLPPFDKPQNFLRLFSDTERKQLMQIVDSIRDNAMVIKSA